MQWLLCAALAVSVWGHGRVLQPPGRASMWRAGFNARHNYDDDGLNCGGFYRQYGANKGKCGICGDAYDLALPRPHELGGVYGKGTIVANYEAGQTIDATIQITAYHKGYWYFKICPDPDLETNQKCFDEHPLELENGGHLYYPPKGGTFTLKYKLPKGLSCKHCILQWRYVAGNNWGYCNNGTEGLGCGNQETFGACSDITIAPKHIKEDKPVEVGIAEGLLKLLQKANVAPYRTKPKRKPPFKKKNHRQPRKKSLKKHKNKKERKDKGIQSWISYWL